MKTKEKNSVALLKGALLLYVIIGYVYGTMHFLHVPFAIRAEYYVFGFNVFLDLLICVLINKRCVAIKRCEILMRSILVLDTIELIVSLTVVETTRFIVVMFCLGIALKLVLEAFFFNLLYLDSIKYIKQVSGTIPEDRFSTMWLLVHLILPLGLFKGVFALGVIVLFARFILMTLSVFSSMKRLKVSNEEINANTEPLHIIRPFKPITKTLMGIAACSCVICFLFFRYTYVEGDVTCEGIDQKSSDDFTYAMTSSEWCDFENNDGAEVVQYTVSNRMPEWSGFYSKKSGLIDLNTGENTGAIYKGRMHFDNVGIAYDNDGHFINYRGEMICSRVPDCVEYKLSVRCKVEDKLRDLIDDEDGVFGLLAEESIDSDKEGFCKSYRPKKYFCNGVAIYYSVLNDKYGMMNQNGDVLVGPEYNMVYVFYVEGTVIFENYYYGYKDVYNSKGEKIIDGGRAGGFDCAGIDGLDAISIDNNYDDDPEYSRLIDCDGKVLDGYFKNEDTIVIKKHEKIKCKRYKDETLSDPGEWIYIDAHGHVVEG